MTKSNTGLLINGSLKTEVQPFELNGAKAAAQQMGHFVIGITALEHDAQRLQLLVCPMGLFVFGTVDGASLKCF